MTHRALVVYRGGVLDHLARKTYLAYIHSNPNCPCTPNKPDLHTQLPQFCMYEKHFFRTRICEAILHVRKTLFSYTHSRGNSSCTKNTSGLHTLEPQLSMYTKQARPTYTQPPTRVNQTKGPLHPPGGPPNEGCLAIKKIFVFKEKFCVYTQKST